MSLTIKTSNAQALLAAIKKQIDDGKIVTWAYDKDGDFIHIPDQWKFKAWLKPSVVDNALNLSLIKPENVTVLSKAVKGVYLERFTEMVSTHFETSFTTIECTV